VELENQQLERAAALRAQMTPFNGGGRFVFIRRALASLWQRRPTFAAQPVDPTQTAETAQQQA
jgi:hypothetical protein